MFYQLPSTTLQKDALIYNFYDAKLFDELGSITFDLVKKYDH